MANCSFARCVQERRLIKRELQKWTRSMVYIVGLERVAEELMGRRKWALYQNVLTTSAPNQESHEDDCQERQSQLESSSTNTATTTTPTIDESAKDSISAVPNNSTATPNGCLAKIKSEEGAEDTKSQNIVQGNCTKILVASNGTDGPQEEDDDERKEQDDDREEQEHSKHNNCCRKGSRTPPVDWRPQDKCYFCDKGRLLTVNERGDLEIGSGLVNAEPNLKITTSLDSDSDSSEVGSDFAKSNCTAEPRKAAAVNHLKMTSLESVVAAVASMHGLPSVSGLSSIYPSLGWFANSVQRGGSDDVGTSSPSNGKSTGTPNFEDQFVSGNSEQPLDLSSKSASSGGLDQKNIFKAKPRMTTITGRRTYTEDELQNALQDILSGKLGTRRAAVLYGIPRSTLRNKVYKLAIEQKREANLAAVAPVLADLDDDDKDCSGAEEEKEVERTLRSLPSEDIIRLAAAQGLAAFKKFGKGDHHNQLSSHSDSHSDVMPEAQHSPCSSKPETPALLPNMMDPNIILQGLIISGALSGLTNNKALENTTLGMLPEFFRNLLLHNELLKSSEGRTSKSETPETASVSSTGRSGSELNENVDDLHLKAPSFKPISGPGMASTSPSSPAANLSKNGDSISNYGLGSESTSRNSPQQSNILGISPPVARTVSESSGSPPMPGLSSVSLRDVIAKSISKTMKPPMHLDMAAKKESMDSPSLGMPSIMDQYKWPTISVKKGLGADVNRFGGLSGGHGSNMMSNNSALNAQLNNNTGTGGKGTRPKRGKYRNYDRDSLVEAVKAVQRGEMSVHRAGSYYGVPHSTLEYKVKERHLMRPRKREPKPQPLDHDRNSVSGPASLKASDMPSAASMRNSMEKDRMGPGTSTSKSPMKTPSFDPTAPNGLKGPPFLDSATIAAAQLEYPPHLFWPLHPPNFPGMTMDFSRAAAAASAGTSSAAGTAQSFPQSDNFFTAQMRQRFQDQLNSTECSLNAGGSGSVSGNCNKAAMSAVPVSSANKPPLMASKTALEFAESLYDGGSANGSFLDGIIRHSLDRKSSLASNQATLLDHLVKSNMQHLGDSSKPTERRLSMKRGATSPLHFNQTNAFEIKRERESPSHESASSGREESSARDVMTDNILKLAMSGGGGGSGEDPRNGGATKNNHIISSNSNRDNHNPGDANNLKSRQAVMSLSEENEENQDSA